MIPSGLLQLYVPLSRISIQYRYFAFFDTEDFRIQGLLTKHKVRAKIKQVFAVLTEKYLLYILRVKKQDIERFEKAMEELPNAMLICGETDYVTTVERILYEIIADT